MRSYTPAKGNFNNGGYGNGYRVERSSSPNRNRFRAANIETPMIKRVDQKGIRKFLATSPAERPFFQT
jgi:hypothetical protein